MISIIIPAYNEEHRIDSTLKSYNSYFSSIGNYEIIVICDGCTDRTPLIVNEYCSKIPNIKLLTFPRKLGKGGAIMKGFDAAIGNWVGFTDADEAVAPKDFYGMIKRLEKSEFDCVIASRRVKGAKILSGQSFQRRCLSRIFNIVLRVLFQIDISDTQCGAKVLASNVYKSIKTDIKSTGFEFDAELLWRIKNKGFSIVEYPVSWSHTKHSRFSIKNGPYMLWKLICIRFSDIFKTS